MPPIFDDERLLSPSGVNAITRSGAPLDARTREAMEARLGHSFANVRVHADAEADDAARALRARAFTAGPDVVFAGGAYAPQTRAGRALLAHELAHVAQQKRTDRALAPAADAEREARAAAAAVTAGRRFRPALAAAGVALQAVEEPAPSPAPTPAPEAAPAEAPTPAPVPAEEEAVRREHEAAAAAFGVEQLDLARDRITVASQAIAREFEETKKKPDDERPPFRTKITALERQLTRALAESVPLLERHVADLQARASRGEDVRADLASAQKELDENRNDLATLGGAFPPEKGEAFEKVYETKLAGAMCMVRAYEGIGALHTPEKAAEIQKDVETKAEAERKRSGENIDHFITVMDTVNAANMAGPKATALWNKKSKTWTPTLESIIRAKINTKIPAYYFFGVALAKAFHSVIVGVSTWGDAPRTLWCDQSGCTVVPGSLDDFARAELEAHAAVPGLLTYTTWHTDVWQILPPAEASLLARQAQEPE